MRLEKEKIKRYIHSFNYIEWPIVILLTIIIIYLLLSTNTNNIMFLFNIMFFLFYIIIIPILIKIHNLRFITSNNLYKYKCNYRILDITIDNNTYYFPIISVLTKFGDFFEIVIKERYNNDNTAYYLTDINITDINESIKDDYNNIKKYFKGGFCYDSQEKASYVISQCEQYINKQKEIRSNIKNGNVDITFRY